MFVSGVVPAATAVAKSSCFYVSVRTITTRFREFTESLRAFMPRPRKTKKEKLLAGTLNATREAARKKTADPRSELEDAREALEAMRQNLRLATAKIAESGLLITTTVSDSHGRHAVVERINPAVGVQAAAMRAIKSLKKQILELEEEVNEQESNKQQDEERSEFAV
jgi:hypothetical protein